MNYKYRITCSCDRTTTVENKGSGYTSNSVGWTQRDEPYIDTESDERIGEGWYCGRPKHMIKKIVVIE